MLRRRAKVASVSPFSRRFTSFAEASAAALTEPSCNGITQEPNDRKYTLRAGGELLDSPSGETSWIKKAGDALKPADPSLHALEPDPCLVVLAGVAPLLEELVAAGSLDRSGVAICRLAVANLQAAAYTMDPAGLAESGPTAGRLIEAAKQLFDLSLSPSMHAEAKALLTAATELFAEANGDANALLDLALSTTAVETDGTPRKVAASAAFVAQALLLNIDTVNKAVSICGAATGPAAAKNLDDHETVVGVVKRLLTAAQHITDTAAVAGGAGDAEPPAAGMVGIVAKIQAGIWAHHKNHPSAGTAALLNRYTTVLLLFATRTIEAGLERGAGADELMSRLRWGPVEGLLPSWIAVLHSEPDWELLSAETLNAVEGFLAGWASWAGASVAKLVRGSSRTVELQEEQRAGSARLAAAVCSIVDKDGSGEVDSAEVDELGRQLVAARDEHKALLQDITDLVKDTDGSSEPAAEASAEPAAEGGSCSGGIPIGEFKARWEAAETSRAEAKFDRHSALFAEHVASETGQLDFAAVESVVGKPKPAAAAAATTTDQAADGGAALVVARTNPETGALLTAYTADTFAEHVRTYDLDDDEDDFADMECDVCGSSTATMFGAGLQAGSFDLCRTCYYRGSGCTLADLPAENDSRHCAEQFHKLRHLPNHLSTQLVGLIRRHFGAGEGERRTAFPCASVAILPNTLTPLLAVLLSVEQKNFRLEKRLRSFLTRMKKRSWKCSKKWTREVRRTQVGLQ